MVAVARADCCSPRKAVKQREPPTGPDRSSGPRHRVTAIGHQRSRDHHASARLLPARRSRAAPRRATLAVRPKFGASGRHHAGDCFWSSGRLASGDRVGDASIARRSRGCLCPTPVAVGRALDGVNVTPSSRGRQRRHRSSAAAPVLAARRIVADTRPILVAGSDRDLPGGRVISGARVPRNPGSLRLVEGRRVRRRNEVYRGGRRLRHRGRSA
jgi:hypothetical protein